MSTKQHFGNAYGTLKVRENGESGSIYITIDSQGSFAGVGIEDAPALALAILEAAGCTDHGDTLLGDAMRGLRGHLHNVAQEAREAADREALEREALELYNKVMRSGKDPLSEWLPTLQFTRIKYTNIAKAAREIHGPTK